MYGGYGGEGFLEYGFYSEGIFIFIFRKELLRDVFLYNKMILGKIRYLILFVYEFLKKRDGVIWIKFGIIKFGLGF